jgi:hypothetical protein
VQAALPTTADDAGDRWRHGGLTVIARADSDDDGASVVLRDSAGGIWSLGHLSSAPERIWWLDAPPLDSAARHALAQAFDRSVTADDDARVARLPERAATAWRLREAAWRAAPPGAARAGPRRPANR